MKKDFATSKLHQDVVRITSKIHQSKF